MSRIVIFANGEIGCPNKVREVVADADLILCADGGAQHALSLGIVPHHVVGDFDSLSELELEELEKLGTKLHRYPTKKDKTDLELTFELALLSNPEEIFLITALGGRLDQLLGNIFFISRLELKGIRIWLVHGNQKATVIHPNEKVELLGEPGDTLSLIPITERVSGVTLIGTEWPLIDADLEFGGALTMSNTFLEKRVEISIHGGRLLVVHITA